MLEGRRSRIVVDVEDFFGADYSSGMDEFYCKWAANWLVHGKGQWFAESTRDRDVELTDANEISLENHALAFLRDNEEQLSNHFSKMVDELYSEYGLLALTAEPGKMRGTVLWIAVG